MSINLDTYHKPKIISDVATGYLTPEWKEFIDSAIKYDTYTSALLCMAYFNDFDYWWDPDKFSWSESDILVACCFQHFTKWWIPDKLKFSDNIFTNLEKYCKEYKQIWEPYYIAELFKHKK